MRYHYAQDSRPMDKATQPNHRFLIFLVLELAAGGVYLVSSALAPTGAEAYQNSLAAAEPAASPSPSIDECLENVNWPPAFTIPFTAYVLLPGPSPSPTAWSGNTMSYQYDQKSNTIHFKAQFQRCTNLPGVPLRFFELPCEFYFRRDPQNPRQYNAYVYSTESHEYFMLAKNFGPMVPDFVERYQKLIPGCLSEPYPGTNLPVDNPPGVAVDWFVTAGHRGVGKKIKPNQPPATDLGYYAAIASPTAAPNGQLYKPPYDFSGAVPGIHSPCLKGPPPLVPGQLVYDWQNFSIVDSLPSGTFTPPSGFRPIPGVVWTTVPKPMNCPTCHLVDLRKGNRTTFYIERGRTGANCPTPTPTPLK